MALKKIQITAIICGVIGVLFMGFDFFYSFVHLLDPHPFMDTTALFVMGYLLIIAALALTKHYIWIGIVVALTVAGLGWIFLT